MTSRIEYLHHPNEMYYFKHRGFFVHAGLSVIGLKKF